MEELERVEQGKKTPQLLAWLSAVGRQQKRASEKPWDAGLRERNHGMQASEREAMGYRPQRSHGMQLYSASEVIDKQGTKMAWCAEAQSKTVVSVSLRSSGRHHFLAGSRPSVLILSLEISSQEFISSEYLKTRVSPCPVHCREPILAYCWRVALSGGETRHDVMGKSLVLRVTCPAHGAPCPSVLEGKNPCCNC